MWTPATRSYMAAIGRKATRYSADLIEEEGVKVSRNGSREGRFLREIVNATHNRVCTRCGGQMLPEAFPPERTIYWWFRRFVRPLPLRKVHDVALMLDHEHSDRERGLSAAIPDSLKPNISDDAEMIVGAIRRHRPRLTHLFAAVASDRGRLMGRAAVFGCTTEIVRRLSDERSCRVIERNPSWMIRWRQLGRGYKQRVAVSKTMIHVAIRRLIVVRYQPPRELQMLPENFSGPAQVSVDCQSAVER